MEISRLHASCGGLFYLLYCKCLTELRDKIFCTADEMILGDHSNNPDQLSQKRAKVCTIIERFEKMLTWTEREVI